MKAIDINPAVISTIGIPWKDFGISLFSILSRIPAKIVIEIVKPIAVPKPAMIDSNIPYSFCTLVKATPRTAQLVVISGRYTPSAS